MNKKIFLIFGFIFCLTGCMFAAKEFPQSSFLLDVKTPIVAEKTLKTDKVIVLFHVLTDSRYDQMNLLYRVSDFRYEPDFYAKFLTPISTQVDLLLRKYLETYFPYEIIDNQFLKKESETKVYIVSAKITQMYADYRNSLNPKGRLDMSFTYQHGTKNILRNYSCQENLTQKTNQALLNSWDRCLAKHFAHVKADLATLLQE